MIVCAAVIGQQVRQLSMLTSHELTFYKQQLQSSGLSTEFYTDVRCHLQNNPLYLQTLQQEGGDKSLRFHYMVHCSLDAVEERRESHILVKYETARQSVF